VPGIKDLIQSSPLLRQVANAIGMQQTVYEAPELPRENAENVDFDKLQVNPLYFLPKSTQPTDLPGSIKAYRADPTGRYGGKEGLETLPQKRLFLGGDQAINPDPQTSSPYDNSIKAIQQLYRYARLNGAAAELGLPAMSPEEIAAFALKEGRSDLGFNSLSGSLKDKTYEEELRSKYNIPYRDINFLAAVNAKKRVADKLKVPFAEAWNGIGVNEIGQTGKQYALDFEKHLKAAKHPKNKELMDVVMRGFADGQKYKLPTVENRIKDQLETKKQVPYRSGGKVRMPDGYRDGGSVGLI
jgi:hypothetical protein